MIEKYNAKQILKCKKFLDIKIYLVVKRKLNYFYCGFYFYFCDYIIWRVGGGGGIQVKHLSLKWYPYHILRWEEGRGGTKSPAGETGLTRRKFHFRSNEKIKFLM